MNFNNRYFRNHFQIMKREERKRYFIQLIDKSWSHMKVLYEIFLFKNLVKLVISKISN